MLHVVPDPLEAAVADLTGLPPGGSEAKALADALREIAEDVLSLQRAGGWGTLQADFREGVVKHSTYTVSRKRA